MPGFVVAERDVPARPEPEGTASSRLTIDASSGCERLEQRILRFGPGRSPRTTPPGRQEVLYVASGSGRLAVGDREEVLEPDTGAYVAADERYTIENSGDDELVVISVSAPLENGSGALPERRTVRWEDRPSLPASPNREFRYLVDHDLGSQDVTQFVGVIPPGYAGMHSHTYDEVIYVVEGEGLLHIDGRDTPISAGSCIHLPPLVEHCLENTGDAPMRVLGVFHPAGDPASRATEYPPEPPNQMHASPSNPVRTTEGGSE